MEAEGKLMNEQELREQIANEIEAMEPAKSGFYEGNYIYSMARLQAANIVRGN